MLVTTKAIVISALKYSEADLIVSCYTASSGLKTYLLPNVLKSRKGKMRASHFQPLTHLDIVARHKDKGNMEQLREVKVSYHYETLHTDIVKSSIVLFLSEILKNVIQEEEENLALFNYLTATTIWLDNNDTVANFHLLFLLNLTQFLGFYPENQQNDLPYFNLLEGTYEHQKINNHCIDGERKTLLKTLLGTKFDALHAIKLNQEQRSAFLNMLLEYYELHLHGFKKPRSLAVLNSIFQ